MDMTCAKVRLRCSCLLLELIHFDQNVGMACANVRLTCSWILLVLIYLIKISVWHVQMLDSGVYGYY